MGMFNIVESATVWVQRKVLDLRAAAPVVPRVLFHYTTRWGLGPWGFQRCWVCLSEIFGENHGNPPDFMGFEDDFHYLVGGLEHVYFCHHIGNVVILTDFHIFQRGGAQPPTSYNLMAKNGDIPGIFRGTFLELKKGHGGCWKMIRMIFFELRWSGCLQSCLQIRVVSWKT